MNAADLIGKLLPEKENAKKGVAVRLMVFIPVLLLAIQFLTEVFSDKIVFRPFKVPPALEEQGYTGEVLTKRVADRMELVRRSVAKDEKEKFIEISTDVKGALDDITLPGTGVSLKHMTELLRLFLGIGVKSIIGDVVLSGGDLYVSANVAGKSCGISKITVKTPEALINGTAEHVMKIMDPFALARFYSIKKKTAAMMRLAKHIRNHHPSKAEIVTAHLIRGLALFDMKRHEDALYQWGLAAAKDGENIKALLYQGWALDELGRHEEALKMYKKAIVLDPGNPAAYNNWAIALYNMNNSGEAIEKFTILTRIVPDYAKAYNNWGYLLFEFGEYKAGIRHIKRAIELDAEQPHFYLNLAEGLMQLGRYEKAVEQLQNAMQLDAGLVEGRLLMVEALSRLGRFDEAFEKYQQGGENEE